MQIVSFMKCQILFSRKYKKYFKMSAEIFACKGKRYTYRIGDFFFFFFFFFFFKIVSPFEKVSTLTGKNLFPIGEQILSI